MLTDEKIKLWAMSTVMLEGELDKVERDMGVDLKRDQDVDVDEDYYPQFNQKLRDEASSMARHYELFYCLEKSIRSMVADTLRSAHGQNWWNEKVPDNIRENAEVNMKREADSGVTIRSEYEIDYTTFGELGVIVTKNWVDFGSMFSNEKAFTKIMISLNTLRGPIAHCCPLAEDEILRLSLSVRDWFRLME